MATYSTPGVYIQEISTFPPSVAEVSTAIPAFIGYTELGPPASAEPNVRRINTLLEYESAFGRARPREFSAKVRLDAQSGLWSIENLQRKTSAGAGEFSLYDALNLYFKNGGGSCYVISIGNYGDRAAITRFEAGLAALEKEDEPTLIVFPDALDLTATDYHSLCRQALAQCKKLGDRFAILDVPAGKVADFRTGIGSDALMYGAAYHPYLKTSLTYRYEDEGVAIEKLDGGVASESVWRGSFGSDGAGIVVTFSGSAGDTPKVKIVGANAAEPVAFDIGDRILTIRNAGGKSGADVAAAWNSDPTHSASGFEVTANGEGSGEVPNTNNANVDLELESEGGQSSTLASEKSTQTALYNQLKTALADQRMSLPPSAAIAGVYARVDRERGVWKAPANVGLAAVIGPAEKINDEEQGRLNIDVNAGKSINAIRAFTGKGTLVWGARTLDGNSNEWRYVSVRRLFNMIEESTQKASAFAVFEANDATTWLKVKAMIESYLFGLWERGALAGSTPEAAYFVNVGLGKTMTPQDILEGRMNVEIGIAAVRPAEFIILKFSHKMQEA